MNANALRLVGAITIGCAAACLCTASVRADTSGLNNIPTADTTPDRTTVFQFKSVLSDESHSQYASGFKMGLEPFGQRFEWGVDGRAGTGSRARGRELGSVTEGGEPRRQAGGAAGRGPGGAGKPFTSE